MKKTDYKKELKELYGIKNSEPVLIDVPEMQFLMIDGEGSPASHEYADAIQTLYPVAYTLKFMCKKELEKDYTVPPLEGLWWADDMNAFIKGDKDSWKWTAMIMQPDIVTQQMYERAVETVKGKKNPASLSKLRLETFREGRSAQLLHIGPYSEETENIAKIHDFILAQGGTLDGKVRKHHEIYLSDPRRVEPSKIKTIIRQPF